MICRIEPDGVTFVPELTDQQILDALTEGRFDGRVAV
jgi:hypothetical protein